MLQGGVLYFFYGISIFLLRQDSVLIADIY